MHPVALPPKVLELANNAAPAYRKRVAGSTGQATTQYTANSNRDGVGTYTVSATANLTGYSSASGSNTFIVCK